MSAAAILGAIAALGTVVGGLVYVFRYTAWATQTTPEQDHQKIDAQVAAEAQKEDQTGRPSW